MSKGYTSPLNKKLPSFNKKVLSAAIKIALALNSKINEEMYFSRKTYFYPDLPSSFQITQYEIPLAVNGIFDNIKIKRVHIEEDPGKLIHYNNYVLIDYNRSGTPLVEIVTEPEFASPEQARLFLQKLLTVLEYLKVYSRKSESSLREDANISTTRERVEIKNIGSIKDVEKALQEEIKRQQHTPVKTQETRGWDQDQQTSILLRTKESELDYGYTFEPNLTKIVLLKEDIERVRKELPELAEKKAVRFIKQYQMKTDDAKVLTSDLELAELFETVAQKVDHQLTARWFVREIPKILNYNKITLQEWGITEKEIIELLSLLQKKEITETVAQKILEKLSEKMFSPSDYVKKEKLTKVSSEKDLISIVEKIIKENQKAVQSYKQGEEKSFDYLIGQVMKLTRGTADPHIVRKLLKEKI
mgnify:CR=1 FL=1